MKISLEEIKKTAKLAKIEITEQEAALYQTQLCAVLDWMDSLQQADTSATEATPLKEQAPLRADAPALSPDNADILAAFADKENNLLKVKKVL
jgi:aspartyl-tRNA(Asn)/glutamyl-tRNA(Gln) amidotransferase subunit C